MVKSLILYSIRNHWFTLLLVILVQVTLGYLVTNHGIIEWNGKVDVAKLIQIDFYEYHALTGKFLLAFAAFLTLEKLLMVVLSVKRRKIPSAFVSSHIRFHFFFLSLQLGLQYITMEFANQFQEMTGFTQETVNTIHHYNGWMILLNALTLTVEKFIVSNGNRASSKDKQQ